MTNVSFGYVIKSLKYSKEPMYAYREGWNGILAGKDMRLTLEIPWIKRGDDLVGSSRTFVLTTDGITVIGWLASQTDMLSEDWVIENE